MATKEDLDAVLQALETDLAEQITLIDQAVQAIIDAIAAGSDLQPEIDRLNAIKTNLDAIKDGLPTTPTPPPPPPAPVP